MINGANPELFVIDDPAHKQRVSVRDASDEQLEKARSGAQQAQGRIQEDISKLLEQYTQACMAHSVFTYEIDRRKRSFTIARIIPS
jgi:hypothetical protein